MIKRLLLTAAVLGVIGCGAFPLPPPEPAPDPSDESGCAAGCEALRALGCPDGDPTPEGDTCEAVCDNAVQNKIPIPTACWSESESCDQATACSEDA